VTFAHANVATLGALFRMEEDSFGKLVYAIEPHLERAADAAVNA
jgi:hypothetical protein